MRIFVAYRTQLSNKLDEMSTRTVYTLYDTSTRSCRGQFHCYLHSRECYQNRGIFRSECVVEVGAFPLYPPTQGTRFHWAFSDCSSIDSTFSTSATEQFQQPMLCKCSMFYRKSSWSTVAPVVLVAHVLPKYGIVLRIAVTLPGYQFLRNCIAIFKHELCEVGRLDSMLADSPITWSRDITPNGTPLSFVPKTKQEVCQSLINSQCPDLSSVHTRNIKRRKIGEKSSLFAALTRADQT